MEYKRSEAKEWARGFYRGLGSTILPSFTPDELALDEKGVRHDIRELIKHGFFSTAYVTEAGTTKEEDKLVIQWCVDEAKGKIGITPALRYYTLKDNIEMAKFAEEIGCDSALLSYPPNFRPKTPQEVLEYSLTIIRSTNIAVELFPSIKYDFPFPGIIPAPVLDKMADEENVVAMKIGLLDWTWIDECFRLFGNKIFISYPFDDAWPTFIRHYGMQWSGAAPWQIFQTPDDPREVRLFNLIQEGKMNEAVELYHKNDPLRMCIMQFTMSIANTGVYNFRQWKWGEELVGMTGGELRMPNLELFTRDREMLRQAALACGLKIVK